MEEKLIYSWKINVLTFNLYIKLKILVFNYMYVLISVIRVKNHLYLQLKLNYDLNNTENNLMKLWHNFFADLKMIVKFT